MFSSFRHRVATWRNRQFNLLLSSKRFTRDVFYAEPRPGIEHPIGDHVHCAYQKFFSVLYPNETPASLHQRGGIVRLHHGIQHTTRVAFYIPILVNLYRRFSNHPFLENISSETIKLLQIAAIFHDVAREDENVDRWDADSGLMLFFYLTSIGVREELATLFASVIANKDQVTDFKLLARDARGQYRFCQPVPPGSQLHLLLSVLIDLLHDADSLDIIRARDVFSATFLNFHKKIAKDNPQARKEMARLVAEIRSLIEIQGDSRLRLRYLIKKSFEGPNAWRAIVNSVDPVLHPLLTYLFARGQVIPQKDQNRKILPDEKFDPSKGCEEKNVQAALREGLIFSRATVTPSALRNKESKALPKETLVHLEYRKMLRRLGEATKAGNLDRDGNDNRSVVLLADGVPTFGCVGGLKIGFTLEDIREIYHVDSGTDRGKKEPFKQREYKVSTEEKRNQLNKLLEKLQLGGSGVRFGSASQQVWTHNEIHYRIRDVDAFFFTQDPTIYESVLHSDPYPLSPLSPMLQAVYVQNEYFNMTGKILPIFEYSGIHGFIRLRKFSVEEIQTMWIDLCVDFIRKELRKDFSRIYDMSLDDIKVLAMYGTKANSHAKCIMPADDNYPESIYGKGFFVEINAAILAEKENLIFKEAVVMMSRLKSDPITLLTDNVFWKVFNSGLLMTTVFKKNALDILLKLSPNLNDCHKPLASMQASTAEGKAIGRLVSHPDDHENIYNLTVTSPFKTCVKLYLIAKGLKIETTIQDQIRTYFESAIENNRNFLPFDSKFVLLINAMKMFYLFGLFDERATLLKQYILDVIKSPICGMSQWCLYDGMIRNLRDMGFADIVRQSAGKTVQMGALVLSCTPKNPTNKNQFELLSYLELAEWVDISFSDRLVVIEEYFLVNQIAEQKAADLNKLSTLLRRFTSNEDQFRQLVRVMMKNGLFGASCKAFLVGSNNQFTDWQLKILLENVEGLTVSAIPNYPNWFDQKALKWLEEVSVVDEGSVREKMTPVRLFRMVVPEKIIAPETGVLEMKRNLSEVVRP